MGRCWRGDLRDHSWHDCTSFLDVPCPFTICHLVSHLRFCNQGCKAKRKGKAEAIVHYRWWPQEGMQVRRNSTREEGQESEWVEPLIRELGGVAEGEGSTAIWEQGHPGGRSLWEFGHPRIQVPRDLARGESWWKADGPSTDRGGKAIEDANWSFICSRYWLAGSHHFGSVAFCVEYPDLEWLEDAILGCFCLGLQNPDSHLWLQGLFFLVY